MIFGIIALGALAVLVLANVALDEPRGENPLDCDGGPAAGPPPSRWSFGLGCDCDINLIDVVDGVYSHQGDYEYRFLVAKEKGEYTLINGRIHIR